MASEHLLLVDDSEAIIRFEQAALGGRYRVSTAVNGVDALAKITQTRPDLVLLDLSMPEMDGDEVLRRMQADPSLKEIPVVIVSSEEERARKCLEGGAIAFLPKPLRADRLNAIVESTLTEIQRRRRAGNLAVLWVHTGGLQLGIPLDSVAGVYEMPATRPLPGGPSYVREYLELRGRVVMVLDLAQRLGREHAVGRVERKVVILRGDAASVALSVDSVSSPEEYAASAVVQARDLGGTDHGLLAQVLHSMVNVGAATLPVIRPHALLSAPLLRDLCAALSTVMKTPAALDGAAG